MNFMTNPVYLILSALVSALYFPLLPIFGTILYFNGKAREEVSNDLNQDLTTLS
jgi:predicted DNA repair protein MutK